MYAVFEISGFQFNAEEGTVLKIPSQNLETGASLDINEVLLIKGVKDTLVGTPFVDGAKVEAEVIGNGLDDKVIIYKYKRRTKFRRTQGHRQGYCEIKVKKIIAPENQA